ncbi:tyrosyl-tRNA synthetase [Mycoplasmopsis gallinacea]|uniref:Tyrosine--tRNA ligase n=1 Tax=Mycoplasmopsis gallinacea TaxID=29556 RepID=A0A0D5ZJR9_9BACT|nr:tyrosyl-tRNA synthetase [Mycoplasmopsis gallinacea]
MQEILNELRNRGILKQISNEDKFKNLKENDGVYCGFDPTAESLHLGNYIQIANLLRFKKLGWNAVAVLGGATGMIGDPSFRNSERSLLDEETLQRNKNKIRDQLERFGLTVVDNYEFYKEMNILHFLRDVGKLVNISYMINKDSVASRIENGLSFTEFTYQLIQGWDFYQLYKNNNVKVQFGGSDQWGNITTGLEIISKQTSDEHQAVGLTINLLTDSNGVKFGKSTGGGNLWIDKQATKPYDMYQFLLNQPDSEVEKLLKWLTFLSIEEIEAVIAKHKENPAQRSAQKVLAFEIIKDLHGEKEAQKAQLTSEVLFNKNIDLKSLSLDQLSELEDNLKVVNLHFGQSLFEQLVAEKIVSSKREAREFLQNKAIKVNGEAINEEFILNSSEYQNKYAFLNVGKKNFYIIKGK